MTGDNSDKVMMNGELKPWVKATQVNNNERSNYKTVVFITIYAFIFAIPIDFA